MQELSVTYQQLEIWNFAIAIRTMILKNKTAYVQAGAGIVMIPSLRTNTKKPLTKLNL